jgi:hypothetical protein
VEAEVGCADVKVAGKVRIEAFRTRGPALPGRSSLYPGAAGLSMIAAGKTEGTTGYYFLAQVLLLSASICIALRRIAKPPSSV